MTKPPPPVDVDAYLATLSPEVADTLQRLRDAIKAAAPDADEVISYRIPTYKHFGPLVHFLANRDYCSLVVTDRDTLGEFKDDLKGFDISGTTIHFTIDKPLPATLVKRIVRARIKQNESARK